MGNKLKTCMGRKEKTIFITIIANVILIALRFFLARLSGSIGMAANAWHSFTDVFVSVVVFVGLMITHAGAEKLGKAVEKVERILAIFVSVFIFYMGIEILEEALSSNAAELRYVPFTAAGAFLGVVINYFMARLKIYVGEQTNSQSLTADGYHSKMDMYCSIAVLVGIVGSLFGMKSLDKVAAICAMILLVSAGYEILSSNLHALLHPEEGQKEHIHKHFSLKQNKRAVAGIVSVLAGAYILSGIYIVDVDEAGIVKRFGAVVKDDVRPGIHFSLPAPIDEVMLVKKDNVQKIEIGSQELLTGDTNLVNVNMAVHFKIDNPKDYAVNVGNVETLISSGAMSSIRKIVGREEIDYLLTEGKEAIEKEVALSLQEIMDQNAAGIAIANIQLVDVSPPEAVQASFQDLASARQDKAIYINDATAYQNTVIPQARADAYKQVAEAESYKSEKISTATGDALLFSERQSAYANTREVTEFRLYMEAMDKILPNVQKILLGSDTKIRNAELWITQNN